MKRIISIILVLVMLFSISCFAEFQNITYGDIGSYFVITQNNIVFINLNYNYIKTTNNYHVDVATKTTEIIGKYETKNYYLYTTNGIDSSYPILFFFVNKTNNNLKVIKIENCDRSSFNEMSNALMYFIEQENSLNLLEVLFNTMYIENYEENDEEFTETLIYNYNIINWALN